MDESFYFDYAAATPLDVRVLAAMQPYFSEKFYNPSATYAPAQSVRADLENARARVAHWLGTRPSEIVFTAGSTEANNLAIRGVMQRFPSAKMVVSALEHESVLHTAREFAYVEAGVSAEGIVNVDKLVALVDDETVLVSVLYASNEIGTVQPIRQLGQALASIREDRRKRGLTLPLYLHTDAAQAAGFLDLHVSRLGVDLLTLNAGKIYGPKGSGALFIAGNVRLKVQASGGGQERGLRSGTENVAGAVGLAEALDLAQSNRHEESERLQTLQQFFFAQVEEKLPEAIINGSRKLRLPNNVHFTLPGQDNERLMFALAEQNIFCATGSACSASNDEPSHVLDALGLSTEAAQASLRFTLGRATTRESIQKAVATLKSLTS
ncbi:MAG TPA: cysteine desulfurase family protein [Candidatus Saccharimonadales bacterium]